MVNIVFSFGLIYRLLFVAFTNHQPVVFDAALYDEIARNILQGSFSIAGFSTAYVMPGFPIVLAGIFKFFGYENFQALRYVQGGLSFVTLYMAFKLIRAWWGKNVALIFAVIGSVYFPFLYATDTVLTETVYSFLLILWITHLQYLFDKDRLWSHWLNNGLLLGLALFTRPVLALFIPLLWIMRKISLRQMILIIGGAAIILSPWIVRNYIVFGHFIPFSTEGSGVFLNGTYIDYRGDENFRNTYLITDMFERGKTQMTLARDNIKWFLVSNPIPYVFWYIRKFAYYWFYTYTAGKNLLPPFLIQYLYHLLLVLLGFWGVWSERRSRNKMVEIAILILVYLTVIHQVFMALDRLALPTMYITLGFSALTIDKLIEALKKNNGRVLLALVIGLVLLVISVFTSGLYQTIITKYPVFRI